MKSIFCYGTKPQLFHYKQSILGLKLSSNKTFSTETSDRYARALFELAQDNSELETIENNSLEILDIYINSKDLKNFIKNPTQNFPIQLKMIDIISKHMNLSKTFKNFLSILVTKRRIFFLQKILNSFLKLAASKRGESKAQLISSKKLTSEELKNISNELSKVLGENLNFDYKIDESLIGGFKMQVGSLMIDTSIKNKLKKYEQIMLEN